MLAWFERAPVPSLSVGMPWEIAGEAADVHLGALVWDQHGCLPLRPSADSVDPLARYRAAGVDVVSINVGFDLTRSAEVMDVLSAFRRGVAERSSGLMLAASLADIEEARRTAKLAVIFDLEGTEPLDGDLDRIQTLSQLGVRSISIAYNRRNRAGGGCHDEEESGLTVYGRALVREMNRVGIAVDASHCSERTSFDLFEVSSAPVMFSHSCPAGIHEHPRNVSDDQIRACATTGGVIGINGVSVFLGDASATTESVVRAIDYVVQLVGPEHVGIGLDYVFDEAELQRYVADHPSVFPPAKEYSHGAFKIAAPEQLPHVTAGLLDLGYPPESVRWILGGNFARVAGSVWR